MPEPGEEQAPGGVAANGAPPAADDAPPAADGASGLEPRGPAAEGDAPAAPEDTASGDPGAADAPVGEPAESADDEPAEPRTRWVFYGLGLSLQTLLWFLLFLAITIAVLVGNKLTEFRYVGF